MMCAVAGAISEKVGAIGQLDMARVASFPFHHRNWS